MPPPGLPSQAPHGQVVSIYGSPRRDVLSNPQTTTTQRCAWFLRVCCLLESVPQTQTRPSSRFFHRRRSRAPQKIGNPLHSRRSESLRYPISAPCLLLNRGVPES